MWERNGAHNWSEQCGARECDQKTAGQWLISFFHMTVANLGSLTLPLRHIWWRHQAATSNSYHNGNAMTLPQIVSTPIHGIQLSWDRSTLINSLSPTLQLVMGSMEVGKTKNFWCDKCCNGLLSRLSVVMDVDTYEERWGKYRGESYCISGFKAQLRLTIMFI